MGVWIWVEIEQFWIYSSCGPFGFLPRDLMMGLKGFYVSYWGIFQSTLLKNRVPRSCWRHLFWNIGDHGNVNVGRMWLQVFPCYLCCQYRHSKNAVRQESNELTYWVTGCECWRQIRQSLLALMKHKVTSLVLTKRNSFLLDIGQSSQSIYVDLRSKEVNVNVFWQLHMG